MLKRVMVNQAERLMVQPPSGGCVLKPANRHFFFRDKSQPPSGGCVLKPVREAAAGVDAHQPPSGGCVLKLRRARRYPTAPRQPPSGGCVLKPEELPGESQTAQPAAFRRLCVETRIPP